MGFNVDGLMGWIDRDLDAQRAQNSHINNEWAGSAQSLFKGQEKALYYSKFNLNIT